MPSAWGPRTAVCPAPAGSRPGGYAHGQPEGQIAGQHHVRGNQGVGMLCMHGDRDRVIDGGAGRRRAKSLENGDRYAGWARR